MTLDLGLSVFHLIAFHRTQSAAVLILHLISSCMPLAAKVLSIGLDLGSCSMVIKRQLEVMKTNGNFVSARILTSFAAQVVACSLYSSSGPLCYIITVALAFIKANSITNSAQSTGTISHSVGNFLSNAFVDIRRSE